MKKLLATSAARVAFAAVSAASAADMPLKAPMAAPVPGYDWTGIYLGVNAGYSWGRSSTNVTYFNSVSGLPIVPPPGSVTSAKFNLNGGIAGGQIGYNQQTGRWVFGVETDLQWSGQRGSANFLCAAVAVTAGPCLPGLTFLPAGATGASLSLSENLQWFGTARARAGMLLTPSVLAYATGGLAYGSIKSSGVLNGLTPGGAATAAAFSNSTVKTGWTVGGGIEARLAARWTGKIEYLYVDYGTVSGTVVNTLGNIGANYSSRITDNVLRAGLNYRFSGM